MIAPTKISQSVHEIQLKGVAVVCTNYDRFSETIQLEETERGRTVKVYAVAPGVIDTPMQEKIRAASSTDFSSHSNFVQLKESNELSSPEEIALKISRLISTSKENKVVQTLKVY